MPLSGKLHTVSARPSRIQILAAGMRCITIPQAKGATKASPASFTLTICTGRAAKSCARGRDGSPCCVMVAVVAVRCAVSKDRILQHPLLEHLQRLGALHFLAGLLNPFVLLRVGAVKEKSREFV